MDRKLLEALRLVQGRGQMSAKDKYGWHPPLQDDGDAMPNQPRDIRNLDKAPEPFLQGKTGADFGQDQFGTPSPNAEKMAKAVGALRLPPVVAPEPTSMKDLMSLPASAGEDLVDPRGDAKTQSIAREHPGHMVVSVDPSSYFGDEQGDKEIMSKASAIPYTMPKAQRQAFKGPTSHDPFQMGSAEDPSAGTDPWLAHPQASENPEGPQPESTDLSGVGEYPESIPMDDMTDEIDIDTGTQPETTRSSEPEQSELQKYIAEMNGKGAEAEDRRDSSFMDSQQKMNSDMGLYKLLFASANKIGSHAGQQSSDEPFNSFADGAIKQNDQRTALLAKDKASQKKAGDDKLKALMFMDKQKQDKEKYQSELSQRADIARQASDDRHEGFQVQRESNEGRNKLTDATLRAQMGLGYDKLSQGEREMLMKMKAQADELELKRNPPVKPMSELDKEELIAKKRENGWLAQGLDKNGKPIKTKVQELQEKNATEVYDDWIQKGGKSQVQAAVKSLRDVARKISADKMASGPIQGFVPGWLQTAGGLKGTSYKNDVDTAISSTFKDTLGGAFSLTEGEALKRQGYDEHATPEENARRINAIADKMEAKARAKDETVKYLDDNGGIQMGGGQAPGKQSAPPAPPGMVNIQNPDTGEIRPVPKASAQKYIDKGGSLVQ